MSDAEYERIKRNMLYGAYSHCRCLKKLDC